MRDAAPSRPPHDILCALGVFILIALIVFAPLIRHLDSHILADDVFFADETGLSDSYNFLWTYWWVKTATLNGESVLHCDWVLPPTGADLLWHTHVIAPSLLTLPLAVLFGTIAGYNLMIILSFVLGAFVFYLFLTRTLDLSWVAALFGGVVFAFAPYFVTKAHAHPNLINTAVWGGCLSILWHAYLKRRFTWTWASVFAVLFWMSLWTSFVETFTLSLAILFSILALEVFYFRRPYDWQGRLRFVFAWVIVGGVALVPILLHGFDTSSVQALRWEAPSLAVLLSPPPLYALGADWPYAAREYLGVTLPISTVALAAIGIAVGITHSATRRHTLIMFLMVVAFLFVAFNDHLSKIIADVIPLSEGFRVFARVFTVALFFIATLAALGLQVLTRSTRHAAIILIGVGAIIALEHYPLRLQPQPVPDPNIPEPVRSTLDEDYFVMYVPERTGPGTRPRGVRIHDTFQVMIDKPVVHLSFLARETPESVRTRIVGYPETYRWGRLGSAFYEEADDLNIRYLYLDDPARVNDIEFEYRVLDDAGNHLLLEIL